MKVRIMHTGYGCDTGCCGHIVETEDEIQLGRFEFDHPSSKEEAVEWAKKFLVDKFGPDHCYDLDFDNSEITNDCW